MLVSQALSLLANLKPNGGHLKHWKRKNKWPKWSVIKISQDFYNKGASVWEAAWLYLVVRLAPCLLKIADFEVDAGATEALLRSLYYKKEKKVKTYTTGVLGALDPTRVPARRSG